MVADGETVMTEHEEIWGWHTGETVTLPFVSVHELRNGKIVRWFDYWDLQTLMSAAPQWWVEHIMVGYTSPRATPTTDARSAFFREPAVSWTLHARKNGVQPASLAIWSLNVAMSK